MNFSQSVGCRLGVGMQRDPFVAYRDLLYNVQFIKFVRSVGIVKPKVLEVLCTFSNIPKEAVKLKLK
jgi:hypothetical protein